VAGPARVTLKVSGVKELQAAYRKVGANVADMQDVWDAIGQGVADGIRPRTPFRTGVLRRSWEVRAHKTKAQVLSQVEYAAPVEYGVRRRGIPPARMVYDTLKAQEAEIAETIDRELLAIGKRADFTASKS